MKVTSEGRAPAVKYLTDTGGNPVAPNPDSPAPDDPVDVALDADAFVPISAATSPAVVQFKNQQAAISGNTVTLDTAPTPGNVLVCFYSSRSIADATQVTGPFGWTAHADSPVYAGTDIGLHPASPTFGWWHVVQTGDGSTVTVAQGTDAGSPTNITVVELAGVGNLADEPSANQQTTNNPKLTGVIGSADAVFLVGADVQQDGGLAYTPDAGSTELVDEDVGGSEWPHQWVGYRIETVAGSYSVGATGAFSLPWGALGFVFDTGGTGTSQQVAPLAVDDDDATYEVSSLAEEVRLDIGTAQVLTSARLLIGFDTSGEKAIELWASNDADMAGAVLIDTETTHVTATPGGGTTGTLVPATDGALAAAIAAASPGDTLRLRGGDHNVDDIIYINKSLTLTNYTGEVPNVTHPTARPEFLFFTDGPNLLDGIVFTGVGGYGDVHGSALVSMQAGSHDLTIQNCEFHGASNMGATQQLIYHHDTTGSGATIQNCLIDGHGSGGFGVHLYPGPGPDDVLVQNNTIRNFPAKSGVVVWTSSSGIQILDNAFANCGSAVRHHNSLGTTVDGNVGNNVGVGLEVDDATNLTVGTNDWSTTASFPASGSFGPDELLFTISDTTAYRYWEFRGPVEDTRTYTVSLYSSSTTNTPPSGYQLLSEKGFPDGYAGLDSSSLVPVGQLPFIEALNTLELDDTLVLAPDGLGGVEFRAETGGTGMSNPMTTQDDIIVGGSSGTPARLAKGSDSQVLTVDPSTHHLVWATPSGGGSALTVKDEGSTLDTAVTSIDFVGAGVVATNTSHAVTVTISGGGGSSLLAPVVVQAKGSAGLNTTNPAVTFGSSPGTDHIIIVGVNLVGRGVSSVSSTNTTYTQMVAFTSGGGSHYEIWVGKPTGGTASGTTITVNTGSSNFSSVEIMEIVATVTPSAGATYSAQVDQFGTTAQFGPLAVTAGRLVVLFAGADNTSNPTTMSCFMPAYVHAQQANGTGCALAVGYASVGSAGGMLSPFGGAGGALIAEVT